jgi:serine/threonine protein kinase/tetratricopeptide (TPR) repeat protein
MLGETISHFKILERLAKGGMGEVYKAEDLRLRRIVALKMLLEEDLDNEEARARFLREAQAASALNHPNIATIYEVDEVERDGKRFNFIAMEYVQGRSLKDLLGKISVDESIKIVMQIADALASAHEMGIVHRDIKPANIILDDQDRVKVLDFGIAKFTLPPADDTRQTTEHTELVLTTPGSVIGTFNYMSPEQALGREVDHRTDIFSLGVLFYELLAGIIPFAANTPIALADAIIHSDPQPVTRYNPLVTPELERIILRALAKDRELRYQDLKALYFDLDAVSRGQTVLLSASTYENLLEDSGHRKLALMSGAGVGPSSDQSGASVAVMSFSNITRNSEDDWLEAGIAETVTSDLKKVEGVTVIGRERVSEILSRLRPSPSSDLDDELATRVGSEVGAHWIICGGFQRFGEMVRITSRIVDVTTGEVLKTVKIDGRMNEIFELQDKVVYEFLRNANLILHKADRQMIEQRETGVFSAYEAFNKGKISLFTHSPQALDEAIGYFEQAISLDPQYARAYVELGHALSLKAQYSNKPEVYQSALANLQKAGSLRPLQAVEHGALGLTLLAMGNDDEGIAAIKRGLEIDPKDAGLHTALGRAYFIGKGQFAEAALEFERALALNPQSGWAALQLAHCGAYLGDYQLGEKAARLAIIAQEQAHSEQGEIRIIGAYTRLGQIYYLQKNYDQAIAEFCRELVALDLNDHALKDRMLIEVNQRLTSAYLRQGNEDDARGAFARMLMGFETRIEAGMDDPFTRYYVACGHTMMGNVESAIRCLDRAAEMRPVFTIARAEVEPDLEALHSDQRFQRLIQHFSVF